jgi:3-hydroxyacyl-[acyl-carrier-protein] dehydratase
MRFYLVDRIEEIIPGQKATGIKCWTLSEDYFAEHFPGFPIVPGVLQIETIAQLMGILIEHSYAAAYPEKGRCYPILSIVQKAKFRDVIIPGDQSHIEVVLTSLDTMRAAGSAKLLVEGKVRAEADLSFTILEAQQASNNPFIGQRDEDYLSLNVQQTLKKR